LWIAQVRLEETWALMHGVTDERYRRELAARANRYERILAGED
jgi:hypothetical protein